MRNSYRMLCSFCWLLFLEMVDCGGFSVCDNFRVFDWLLYFIFGYFNFLSIEFGLELLESGGKWGGISVIR